MTFSSAYYLQISLQVRDQRTPEKYGTAEVDVIIKRDRFTPEFQNQPYIRTNFPYRSNVGDNVLTVTATDRDLEVGINLQIQKLGQNIQGLCRSKQSMSLKQVIAQCLSSESW